MRCGVTEGEKNRKATYNRSPKEHTLSMVVTYMALVSNSLECNKHEMMKEDTFIHMSM